MICPIEQSLNLHLSSEEQNQLRCEAIENKACEIQDTLIDNETFTCFDGRSVDLIDWFADFETENDTLAEFLKETMAYGNGQYLRNKMIASLEDYCMELAIDEIDNARG